MTVGVTLSHLSPINGAVTSFHETSIRPEGKASMMISYLKALQDNSLKDYVKPSLKYNSNHLVKTSELARNAGFSVKEMEAIIKELMDEKAAGCKVIGSF